MARKKDHTGGVMNFDMLYQYLNAIAGMFSWYIAAKFKKRNKIR